MRSFALKLCVALLAGSVLLVAAAPAEARHDRSDYREWRKDHRSHGPGWGQHRYNKPPKVVVTRPVGRHTVVEHHHYHPVPHYRHAPPRYAPPRHAPPHRYGPSVTYYPYPVARDPAIIISVPPIVIPLR